jgi:hypothetical protein
VAQQGSFTAQVRLTGADSTGNCPDEPFPPFQACDFQCRIGVAIPPSTSFTTSGWSNRIDDNNSPRWGNGSSASVSSSSLYQGTVSAFIDCEDYDAFNDNDDIGRCTHMWHERSQTAHSTAVARELSPSLPVLAGSPSPSAEVDGSPEATSSRASTAAPTPTAPTAASARRRPPSRATRRPAAASATPTGTRPTIRSTAARSSACRRRSTRAGRRTARLCATRAMAEPTARRPCRAARRKPSTLRRRRRTRQCRSRTR